MPRSLTRFAALTIVAAACIGSSDKAAAQSIRITLTDKTGTPRPNLELSYDIKGINVEKPASSPVSIIADEFTKTDSTGSFEINATRLRRLLRSQSAFLNDSKQVRIDLHPISATETLLDLSIHFLLGIAGQDISLVMMRVPAVHTGRGFAQAAFQGNRGTFHLLGEEGTGFYWNSDGQPALVQLRHYRNDENFSYYRETGTAGVRWAFAHHAVTLGAHDCAMPTGTLFSIWISNSHAPARWTRFDYAKRTVPTRLDTPGSRTSAVRSGADQ